MQFKHAPVAVSAVFDDPNLVSVAGLVPMPRLARSAGLDELAQSRLSVPTDKGANAGGKMRHRSEPAPGTCRSGRPSLHRLLGALPRTNSDTL